jgi:hypothetical protein
MPFDYAALSLAEIRDDLADTLSEQVFNAGQGNLESLLNAIEEDALVNALAEVSAAPSDRLVVAMSQLVEMEPYGHLPEPGIRLAEAAIRELRLAAGLVSQT